MDFGKEPAVADDLNAYVSRRLVDQLRDDYGIDVYDDAMVRAVYNPELNRFRRSVYGRLREDDPPAYRQRELAMLEEQLQAEGEHVGRCINHLQATTGKGVVVVLDNVDQRPTSFQERVFLIGEGIANSWPATVFLALRPSTFHESRNRGSLSGYHSRVFTVYPARTDDVINRRLRFARRQLAETGRLESFPPGLSLDSASLLAYLDVLIKGFSTNEKLKEMLDNLSGGNLRVALDFLNAFVGSGDVSTARILDIASRGGTYTIPLHEFFRAIAYGDAEEYDPSQSPIVNVFDITQDDGREHFLLPSLLQAAQQLGEAAGGNGYVQISDLFGHGQRWGYTQEQTGAQLQRCFEGKLLDGDVDSCRVTTIGTYTVRRLTTVFSYVDAVVVDTPIVDRASRSRIREVRTIQERLERASAFRDYLDNQWEACRDASLPFDWPSVSASLKSDIAEVTARAGMAQARRAFAE